MFSKLAISTKITTVQFNFCMGKHFMYCITPARVSMTEVSRWNRVGSCMRISLLNVYPKCVRNSSRAAHVYNYITCICAPIAQYTLKITAPISHYYHIQNSNFIFQFNSVKALKLWLLLLLFIFRIVTDIQQINTYFVSCPFHLSYIALT